MAMSLRSGWNNENRISARKWQKKTIHVPLTKSLAGTVAWAMNRNRQNFLGYVNEEEIKIGIDTSQEQLDNLPSKKELKEFFSKSIEILKEHKGLVLVEVADHEGDHIKITL